MKLPSLHPTYSSRFISILISISMVLIISSSCVEDIFIDNTDKSLRLSIAKQSYQPGSNETKTLDTDYSTSFTLDDRIGIIASGGSLTSPIHCGYVFNATGEWEPLSTPVPTGGATYLIYYPYDPALTHTVESDIIDNFVIPTDQSDQDKYSKADLMTGAGTIQSDNTLSVQLSHKLSLVEMEYPANSSDQTLTVNAGSPITPLNISGDTYRCIVPPGSNLTIGGAYESGGMSIRTYEWSQSNVNLEAGKYRKIAITNAAVAIATFSDGRTEEVILTDDGLLQCIEIGPISTITIDATGDTYHIGRHTSSGPIYLNIDESGALQFRPADPEGFIPIGSIAEFQMINNNLDGKYKLEADIDLLGADAFQWTPIGPESSNRFTGTFDGNGKRIENLYINNSNNQAKSQGLFGYVSATGKIINVHITGGSITITRSRASAGGIVGDNDGIIEGCSYSGSLETRGIVGGVVGNNYGSIIACCNTGNVHSNLVSDVGGVAGNNYGSIIACYNTGNVKGSGSTGGVAGDNYSSGSIIASYNTGKVESNGFLSTSGVTVDNSGTIEACYWLDVSGDPADYGIKYPQQTNDNATPFDGSSWPSIITHLQWGIGDGSGDGLYWKSLGGWVDGNEGKDSEFPKLWFE